MKREALKRWTSQDSEELYGVNSWGCGYLGISPDGKLMVRADGTDSSPQVSLVDLVNELPEHDMSLPVLVRVSDVLYSRIDQINTCFATAMKEEGYKGDYRAAYPTKVNHQREVVEDIMAFGRKFHQGLEVGSKAELMVGIAYSRDPEAHLICNGYKDEEFINLALQADKMGLQVYVVVEMPDELELVLNCAKRLGVRPRLGVRAKLSSRGGGHWDASGGDRSKFGLNASQVIDLVDRLRADGMLDCLRMLHYHLGSQISDIRKVRAALNEACSFYVDLVREGAPMGILNVGGGLAVDYDGSHTNYPSSTNYGMAEYAADVVEVVMHEADKHGVPHPTIVSESGRATVAHHSMLIFNVLDVRRFEPRDVPCDLPEGTHELVANLAEVRATLTPRNAQESYHDAVYYRDQVRSLFVHGTVSLRERARAESLFWEITCRIADIVRDKKYIPDEMQGLDAAIADVYYGNFSVFQSIPDYWAVDHVFPVMPIHRLDEEPTRYAVLADITCDSDGKIDRFIDLQDVNPVLPLHELTDDEYYLGVFLLGGYQETIGSMHNLLGDVNALHVRIKDGQVDYVNEIAGDSVGDMLSYVEYDTVQMMKGVRETAEEAVRAGKISEAEMRDIVDSYETSMQGYTYFEK